MNTSVHNDAAYRARRCGACGETGHDRRTCSMPTEVERRHERNRIRFRDARRLRCPNSFKLVNNNHYPICLYWSEHTLKRGKYLQYVGESGVASFTALPAHSIIAVPANEFTQQDGVYPIIDFTTTEYFIAGIFTLSDFLNQEIHLIKEYHPTKKELDQWKECAFKSLFLLKELERMGVRKYDHLESIMDMVQDINLPTHTELDKEFAGIPSGLTNIT